MHNFSIAIRTGFAMPSTLIVLASLLGIYIPILVSPGPNFLVVTQTAATQSRRHAICAALGVSSASTILAAFAATGMGILVAHLPGFQHAVQLVGGIYLLYMAARIWRQSNEALGDARAVGQRSLRQAYWFGLATNLSNPKALVFFATIFASMIPPGSSSLLIFVGVLGICATSSLWHLVFRRAAAARLSARQAHDQSLHRLRSDRAGRRPAVAIGSGIQKRFLMRKSCCSTIRVVSIRLLRP